MIKKFLKFVNQFELFSEKDKLILGVSGGVDSIVLLDLICKLFPKNEKALIHVDHSIRNDTRKDVQLINDISKKYNIKSYVSKIDVLKYCKENKMGTEEGARKLRYEEFIKVFKRENADYILTAHNLDDLSENLIMRITRGTGLDGLPGMKPKNGFFVKPLLFASKREIVEYAKKSKLKWRDDYTNNDLKYTRNSIRHKVIPILKEHNPNFLQSIFKLSKILWIQKEHIDKEVENIGARRLQTMFEKILEKLSFEANLSEKRTEVVSKQWVSDAIQSEIKPTDEKKFIL
jgi:tRNA(Ile)-lysidine synthase